MAKKTCRVLITSRCCNNCSYCCNKLPKVQKSIKFITMDELIKKDYKIWNITGGEPMLEYEKLLALLASIDKKGREIYLYTTGYCHNMDQIEEIAQYIDGVNIGIHGKFDIWRYEPWFDNFTNIRLHIQKGKLPKKIRGELLENGFKIKEWEMNKCDNDNEDRWII